MGTDDKLRKLGCPSSLIESGGMDDVNQGQGSAMPGCYTKLEGYCHFLSVHTLPGAAQHLGEASSVEISSICLGHRCKAAFMSSFFSPSSFLSHRYSCLAPFCPVPLPA